MEVRVIHKALFLKNPLIPFVEFRTSQSLRRLSQTVRIITFCVSPQTSVLAFMM